MNGRVGFEASNGLRDYPLVQQDLPVAVPHSAIRDFQTLVGPGAGFDPEAHDVALVRIARILDTLFFDFECDAPGLIDCVLRFSRDIADADYATDVASRIYLGGGDGPDAPWSGVLTTGDLGELIGLLSPGDEIVGRWPVEPVTVRSADGLAVMRIAMHNHKRLSPLPDPECDDDGSDAGSGGPGDSAQHVLAATFSGGVLRVDDGYNMTAALIGSGLFFTAQVGAGWGEVDEELRIYPGEEMPEGSNTYEGADDCSDVIRSISGLSAPRLRFNGVRVEAFPAEHEVHLYIDESALGLCGQVEEEPQPPLGPEDP